MRLLTAIAVANIEKNLHQKLQDLHQIGISNLDFTKAPKQGFMCYCP